MTTHTIILSDARAMPELDDESVHLVVTSPPYWQLKDYGVRDQIGFDDTYRDYIDNLNLVWEECARVLHPGCRLCVNIGDQFARAAIARSERGHAPLPLASPIACSRTELDPVPVAGGNSFFGCREALEHE